MHRHRSAALMVLITCRYAVICILGTCFSPCSLGPTCSASWCLCSAEVFSSSAMRVCCCCTTERRCLMQLWFGSSSLGISRLPPRVGKENRSIQWDMWAEAEKPAERAFSYPKFLYSFLTSGFFLLFILFTSSSLARPSPFYYLLSLGFFPSLRQCFIYHMALLSSNRFCLCTHPWEALDSQP